MPTLNRAIDGHWFIIKGYPITENGETEIECKTLQITPSGETLIHESGLRSGSPVAKAHFYLLFVERCLYTQNSSTDEGWIGSVPRPFRERLLRLLSNPNFSDLTHADEIQRIPVGSDQIHLWRSTFEILRGHWQRGREPWSKRISSAFDDLLNVTNDLVEKDEPSDLVRGVKDLRAFGELISYVCLVRHQETAPSRQMNALRRRIAELDEEAGRREQD